MFKYMWLMIASSMPIPQSILKATSNPVAKFFDFNQPGSGADIIKFYEAWSGTLHTRPLVWVKIMGGICSFLSQTLYAIAHTVEQVFNSMFGLFDILKISQITGNGRFAKLHMILLLIACALLLVSLAMIFISMIMGNRNGIHEVAQSIFTGLIVIVMLPAAVGWLGDFGQAATKDINTIDSAKTGKISSTALEPFKANTIDLLQLANDNFNTDPNKVGGSVGMAKYNNLTDANLNSTPFTDIVAGDNIKALKDVKNGNVFKYQIQPGIPTDGKQATENLVDLSFPSKQFGITMVMDSVYPRYIVNWWLVAIEEIVLAMVFVLMAIKLAKSIFEIITLTMVAPIVSFGSLRSSKNVKTLITTMIGSVMGIVTEVVTVKIFLIVVNYLPQSSVLSGLGSGWGKGIATVVVYVGAFMAMFTGINWIERWLGTPTGTNAEGRGLMAGFAAGSGMGRGVGQLTGGVAGAGSAIKRLIGGAGGNEDADDQGAGALKNGGNEAAAKNAADDGQADMNPNDNGSRSEAAESAGSTTENADQAAGNADEETTPGADTMPHDNTQETMNPNSSVDAGTSGANDDSQDATESPNRDSAEPPVEDLGDEDSQGGIGLDSDTDSDTEATGSLTTPADQEESGSPDNGYSSEGDGEPNYSSHGTGYNTANTDENIGENAGGITGGDQVEPQPGQVPNASVSDRIGDEATEYGQNPSIANPTGSGQEPETPGNTNSNNTSDTTGVTPNRAVETGRNQSQPARSDEVHGQNPASSESNSSTNRSATTPPNSATQVGNHDEFPSAQKRLRDLGDLKK